jgi:hypothetical protein
MHNLFAFIAVTSLVALPAAAQTDYRNLDAERPLLTEDAYPLERGVLELSLPYSFHRSGGASEHFLAPEFGVGLDNAQLTFSWPLGHSEADGTTSLGPRLGLLYTPFTQPRRWPALALRLDAAAIEGSDGALDGRVTGKLIATRSFGTTRMHLNGSFTAGPEAPKYRAEFPTRASATMALDRTLWRGSLLIGIETGARQEVSGAEVAWLTGAGVRWQWTPVDVVDLGYRSARYPALGTRHSLAVGLTHAWGRGRPSRRAAPRGVPALDRRDEQFYTPGSFNWRFLATEPEGARLFNAFDYGHAVLYERLLTRRGAELDASLAEAYRYLTTDLLVRPPRFAIAEEAVMPRYAEEFWRAKQVFEWAHELHRQIYDVYADDGSRIAGRGSFNVDSTIEALTDRYLERVEYALAPVPKAMALMEGQPYSGVFARSEPKFNGLIWAYHWLQVGLYEPYARRSRESGAGRGAGVDSTFAGGGGRRTPSNSKLPALDPVLVHFRGMVASERFPEVMPMTSAVAPTFTTAHPRAAAIFDNLHSLHDVISDILLNDAVVPRDQKRAAVYRAIAAYQDATRDVEADEHWRMMGEMVGGVERMGGAVP